MTPYTPTNSAAQSPVINVIHIAQTNGVRGNVYGGGNEALVTAHPKVYIGYDANTMSNLLPSDYPAPEDLTNFPHAYVTGKVFGGGNKAGVSSTEVNILGGTVVTAVHGGCNEQGAVGGNAIVNVVSGTIGAEGGTAGDVFGGGYGQPTTVAGDVNVTIGTENGATTTPYIYGTIYGGSALGSVNTNTDNLTKVWLRSGTVGERVYGGGLGQKNGVDGATSDIAALVNGDIQVIDDGTDVNTCIYGGNDKNGDPAGTIEVTINAGTIGNVVGGGNLAAYTAPTGNLDYPYVYIHGGTVTNKVVGGGNAASITGNPRVVVDGGTIGTDSDATTGLGKGIYGGCNASGTVTGNTTVTLTGGTIGVSTTNKANIHGGGYGEPTNVTGNVLVNFGADDDTQAIEFPKLFGDLYGGSALGNVNTNADNTTIVNLRNGTINGAAYGGGLGDKESLGTGHSNVEAKVNGKVYVNVGSATDPDDVDTYKGQATLIDCDIYGCNNLNGSPQDNVYLNVYKTAHIPTNIAGYVEDDRTYAIDEVFGGGNQADFTPTGKKTYVHIHKCENTVRRLFGGGNAAYVPGIDLTIDGGRLFWVFGGGNGELGAAYAANIGAGGIFIHLGGGRIDLLVNGSNEHGDVLEGGSVTLESFDGCENSVVIDHFMGANQTTIYGNITETIECGTDKRFVNLYCGSNLAQIYGNINLTIEGGVFENVFGGSKGSLNNTSNPQGFQTYASSIHDNPYTTDVLEGHVNLLIKGGTIGNIYGACDVNGNVDGKVTITVNRDESSSCDPLFFIGNIYGGGNHTDYTPINIGDGNSYSPEVIILKGVIGGTSPLDDQNHPLLPVLNPSYILPAAQYEGNVFGGGNLGNVTGNPRIIIGEKTNSNKVIIEGNVFGGGNEGNVTGSPEVIIVPTE